jgi:hypothetical protein
MLLDISEAIRLAAEATAVRGSIEVPFLHYERNPVGASCTCLIILGTFMRTPAMPKTAEPWSLTSLHSSLGYRPPAPAMFSPIPQTLDQAAPIP